MMEILAVLAACAILGSLGAWLITRWKPGWSRRKAAIMAALPLPSIIWVLCFLVFVNAAFSSRESCGVDACGMAMMFSVLGAGYGLLGYLAGIVGAFATLAISKKSSLDVDAVATFE